jgi:hypothetical protein
MLTSAASAPLSPCPSPILALSYGMPAHRNRPKRENFNVAASRPFQLRLEDLEIAMQGVYDLFYDVNTGLLEKGLERLDDFLRPVIMSGLLSDLLTASMAKHSRFLTQNNYSNGHPDLVVRGAYPNDSVNCPRCAFRVRFGVGIFQRHNIDVLTSLMQDRNRPPNSSSSWLICECQRFRCNPPSAVG